VCCWISGYIVHEGYPNHVFHGYISADGEESWDVHLRKDGISLVNGHLYTINFDAHTIYGRERDINVVLEKVGPPLTNYSNAPYFHLNSQMKTFEYTFEMTCPTDPLAGICIEMGECSVDDTDIPNEVIIDNISIEENIP